MRYSLLLVSALAALPLAAADAKSDASAATVSTTVVCSPAQQEQCPCDDCPQDSPLASQPLTASGSELFLTPAQNIRISVVGQGVAPVTTTSPAQAYALAKRAAIADAYRLLAEKVKGVRVEGQDLIRNMMVKRSTIRTYVDAMIRAAEPVETTFKEGLCEVEMELLLSYSQLPR